MNILVIDDESVILRGMKRTLEQTCPEDTIHLSVSGEEAMHLLAKQHIDIVLTDILMPGINGLELMRISRPQYPWIKWVFISAHSEFSYAQQAIKLGAKDYLLKPIGKRKLIGIMASLQAEVQQEAGENGSTSDHLSSVLAMSKRGGESAVDAALQFMSAHYNDDKLSLEKAAAEVFLNPIYFSQLFKQKTGFGYKEYVTKLRMDEAKRLLDHNHSLKIADVAHQVGYQDVRHFTQVFRKRFGLTPTEYRQQ